MPITVENLRFTYMKGMPFAHTALDGVSFSVSEGEFVGIIGHTGCGKSTLIQAVAGLLKPESGRVLLDGEDINAKDYDRRKLRSRVGVVFQYPEYQLFEETVIKDIGYGPRRIGVSEEEIDTRVRHAMELIFTGQVGGHFAAWRDLTVRQLGVMFVPIELTFDDENWKVAVPGMIDGEGGPYRDLMVPNAQVCKISNAPRPEVGPGDITVGQARKNVLDAFGFKWDWSNYSAKHIPFEHKGPGAFTWRRPLDQQL